MVLRIVAAITGLAAATTLYLTGHWVIGTVFLPITFIAVRMDYSLLLGDQSDASFMGTLKALGDACCLGNIFKRR